VSENGFAIAWTAASRRALTRLPEKAATAVVEFLYGSASENPRRAGKSLRLGLEGTHNYPSRVDFVRGKGPRMFASSDRSGVPEP
jgi:hypothetical protein